MRHPHHGGVDRGSREGALKRLAEKRRTDNWSQSRSRGRQVPRDLSLCSLFSRWSTRKSAHKPWSMAAQHFLARTTGAKGSRYSYAPPHKDGPAGSTPRLLTTVPVVQTRHASKKRTGFPGRKHRRVPRWPRPQVAVQYQSSADNLALSGGCSLSESQGEATSCLNYAKTRSRVAG